MIEYIYTILMILDNNVDFDVFYQTKLKSHQSHANQTNTN